MVEYKVTKRLEENKIGGNYYQNFEYIDENGQTKKNLYFDHTSLKKVI